MVFFALHMAKSGKFAIRLALVAPLAAGLGGCASQFPVFDSFFSSDPLVTGSTTDIPAPFDQSLKRDDWLTAEPALELALEPANQDTAMDWKQSTNLIKGSFRPIGTAFTKNGTLCRNFSAMIEKTGQEPQAISATACRFGAGPWLIREGRLG